MRESISVIGLSVMRMDDDLDTDVWIICFEICGLQIGIKVDWKVYT